MGGFEMLAINKKFCVVALSLVLMFAAAMPASASAQSSFGGSMSTKSKIKYIGGGAAAGAIIGGLLSGKKGAVIGGLLGGGAGAGYVYIKGKREEDRYGRYYRQRRFRR
jgi:uncharacterized membrane protein YebE (DUF533 family)